MGESVPKTRVGIEETARLIAEVFWWLQETGSSYGPSYPVEDHQLQVANALALETEQFLLAHEVGHVLDEESNYRTAFVGLEQIDFSQREEHAADLFGVFFMLEVHKPEPKSDALHVALAYAGVEFALQIYRTLEAVGFRFRDSHPPAARRLEVIRADMRRRCESTESWDQLSALSSGIDHLFASIIQVIKDPGEHSEFFERSAQGVVQELERLLTECSGGVVPDYGTFYTKAGPIFDRGYSHRLLARVAQAASDFATDVQDFKVDGAPPAHESWVRFQKFKLLFAFTREFMPEPARTLFLNAIDRVMT